MFRIEADFNISEIDAFIKQEIDKWFRRLAIDYSNAMRVFVDRVRSQAEFGNITWRLRSSIGGIVIYNNHGNSEIVDKYFPTLNGALEGSNKGEDYAREVAVYSQEEGVQAIIVVGMDYAQFVETTRGDIISVASAGFPKDLLAQFRK